MVLEGEPARGGTRLESVVDGAKTPSGVRLPLLPPVYRRLMPDEIPLLAPTAQQIAYLVPRLSSFVLVQKDEATTSRIIDHLHILLPRVAIASVPGVGVQVWYRDGEDPRPTPKSLHFEASRVEVVREDGSARIVKDRTGVMTGMTLQRTTCPKHLLDRLYPQYEPHICRRTWQELLLVDVF